MESIEFRDEVGLALQHFAAGRLHAAEALCQRVLTKQPRHAEALHLLGALAHQAGYLDDAIALMRQAIDVRPLQAEYHSNLAVALTAARQPDAAIASCERARAIDPRLVDALYNLGNALRAAGRPSDAAGAYRRAIALRFDHPQAHNNLGNALRDRGELEAACAAYRQALFFQPAYAHARSNLAVTLEETGRLDDAIDAHRQAVDAAPRDPAIHSNQILASHYDAGADARVLRDAARGWNARHGQPAAAVRALRYDQDRAPERPLRIGYVSSDLRLHSVAFFLLPLLDAHDRGRFHVTCYASDARADDVTARLQAASDAWCSIAGVPDDAVAARIRHDRIDILVDLNGHTAGNRLPLFARRPAPVQMTYLGLPATTGVDVIDYRITDAVVDPPDADDVGCERPLRLARVAWCFAPLVDGTTVSEPPAMREGHVTFGSFNGLKKTTPATLALWAAVLLRVPTSRLHVKSPAFGDAEAVDRFGRFFTSRGVAADRLELLPGEPSLPRHLQSHDRIDIALDTVPFNGLTVTCQALWMGVPVVTLAGSRPASRMGASVLAAVGLPRLVAHDAASYVQCAVDLAGDLPALARLRAGLRERLRTSPVMDAVGVAADLGSAYRDAWRTWCATEPASQ